MWSMRLAKEGYGTITEIKNLDIGTFINLIHYDNFINKYQEEIQALNQKE